MANEIPIRVLKRTILQNHMIIGVPTMVRPKAYWLSSCSLSGLCASEPEAASWARQVDALAAAST